MLRQTLFEHLHTMRDRLTATKFIIEESRTQSKRSFKSRFRFLKSTLIEFLRYRVLHIFNVRKHRFFFSFSLSYNEMSSFKLKVKMFFKLETFHLSDILCKRSRGLIIFITIFIFGII